MNERIRELETFIDPCYYDMWCVKPKGMKEFNKALHFATEEEALYAKQCIEEWIERLDNINE